LNESFERTKIFRKTLVAFYGKITARLLRRRARVKSHSRSRRCGSPSRSYRTSCTLRGRGRCGSRRRGGCRRRRAMLGIRRLGGRGVRSWSVVESMRCMGTLGHVLHPLEQRFVDAPLPQVRERVYRLDPPAGHTSLYSTEGGCRGGGGQDQNVPA
jgi:hypothetical protein